VALVAEKSGNALTGLVYPAGLLLVALTVGYFFLPETRGADLNA
jgi:hypothetical protein